MATKKNEDYGLLMTGQGFYFGRLLKNGTMSADSKPVGQDELLNAFAAMFERHCATEQTNEQWIGIEGGGAILIKRFTAEDLRNAATKANKAAGKREQTGARSQSAERKQTRPQVKAAKKKK
jgi:hypothetical protein